MSVSYVERDQASAETLAFYDKAEDRFKALLNIFKVFGHQPEYGPHSRPDPTRTPTAIAAA